MYNHVCACVPFIVWCIITGEFTGAPHAHQQYHQTGPHEDLYEAPQNNEEETALYDVPPPENSTEYAEVAVSRAHAAAPTTSAETYTKFDNPLYETH